MAKMATSRILTLAGKATRITLSTVLVLAQTVQSLQAGQITINAGAPVANQAGLTTSSGGRATVNIVAPVSGVSVNRFSAFEVDANGVILNNATTDTAAKKGGTVKANPNLGTAGPANTIVNQVNGGATTLSGDVETVGTRASVIIANPNGVTCNGCSSTGASRMTLTTGVPTVMGGQVGITTTDGIVAVGRNGISGDGDVTLSGRTVTVDGPSNAAGALELFGGTHAIDPQTGKPVAQPIVTSRKLPYAVDATAFGALNAGTIRVVGSEAGMGVRAIGSLTSKGAIELSSKGDLFYKDATAGGDFKAEAAGTARQYGTVKAGGNASLSGANVYLPGGRSLTAGGLATVNAIQAVTIGGEVSGANLTITAGSDLNNTGILAGDQALTVNVTGNIVNSRDKFTVYSGYDWADWWLAQYKDLFQQWTQSSNPDEVYWGNEYLTWSATPIVDEYLLKGGSILGTDVTLAAGQSLTSKAGKIAAVRDLTINAGLDVSNLSKTTINQVTVADGCAANTSCGTRVNQHPAEILAGRDLSVTAGRDIINAASLLAAGRNVSLTAGQNVSSNGTRDDYAGSTGSKSEITASDIRALAGTLSLKANGNINLEATSVSAGGDLIATAGGTLTLSSLLDKTNRVAFPGELIGTNVGVTAKDVVSKGGRLFGRDSLSIAASGNILIDAGEEDRDNNSTELTATLPDATSLATRLANGDATLAPSFATYRSNDGTLDALVALKASAGGKDLLGLERGVGGDINFGTIQVAYQRKVKRGWFGHRWITEYADHTQVTGSEGTDLLSDALGDRAPTQLSSDILAATAYDFAVSTTIPGLKESTRSILETSGNLTIKSGASTVLAGGAIAHAGRNMRLEAGSDLVLLSLARTGVGQGSDLVSRQDIFTGGQAWLTPGAATMIVSAGDPSLPNTNNQYVSYSQTSLIAGGDATFVAGRDILSHGASVAANGNIILSATRDIGAKAIGANFVLTAADGCQNSACGMMGLRFYGAEFLAGAGLIASAGEDITNAGSSLAGAGSVLVNAGGDLHNDAVSAQYLINYLNQKKKILGITIGKKQIAENTGIIREGDIVSEFGGVTLKAGHDLVNIGSAISAGGAISLSAANDVLMDAKTEEMANSYQRSGFSGIGYASNKSSWNGFINAFTDIEGSSINIAAGHNLTGIGAKLVSGADTTLSAANDLTFDAQQNAYYQRSSGWSIGFTSPAFSIASALAKGDGKQAFAEYVQTNPLLAAVHQLAITRGAGTASTLGNALTIGTGGVRILAAANIKSRYATSTSLGEALAAQFSPLAGNALDPFALYETKGAGLSDAAKNCVSSPLSCSFLAGISLRFSTWKSEKEWTESTVSRLLVGQDLTASAGHDLALVGGTIASSARDLTLIAGNNIGLAAVADTSRSKASSWGITLGIQAGGFSIGADASRSNAAATVYSNAQALGGRDVTMVAGQDIALIGANVTGKTVTLDAARDLSLISQQNVSTASSSSFNIGLTVSPPANPTNPVGLGLSLGLSMAKANRVYTDTPTTVVAEDRLDAYAGRNTLLAGAGMWSKTGNLKLDTGGLAFDNYTDKDKSVSGSINVSLSTTHPWDGSLSAAYANKTGLTFATIGKGDLNIRNKPLQDISGLNRDPANMQKVTSQTSWTFTIPALNIAKLADDLTLATNYINALTKDVPKSVKDQGDQAVMQYNSLILRGATDAQARQMMATPEMQKALLTRQNLAKALAQPDGLGPSPIELIGTILNGENAYWDATRGTYVIETNCASNAGPTPCQTLVSRGQLQKAYTADDVKNFYNAAFDALNAAGSDPSADKRQNARLAMECLVQYAIQYGDPGYIANARTAVGADEFNRRLLAVGMDTYRVGITERLLTAARAGSLEDVREIKAELSERIAAAFSGPGIGNTSGNLSFLWQTAGSLEQLLQTGGTFDQNVRVADLSGGSENLLGSWISGAVLNNRQATTFEKVMLLPSGAVAAVGMAGVTLAKHVISGTTDAAGVWAGYLDGPYKDAQGQSYVAYTPDGVQVILYANKVTGEGFWVDPSNPTSNPVIVGAMFNLAALAQTGGLVTTVPEGTLAAGIVRRSSEWKMYEDQIRQQYVGSSLGSRSFQAIVDGKLVTRYADDVVMLDGRQTAIEVKYVGSSGWQESIRNPESIIGSKAFAMEAQQEMLTQARVYSENFPGGVVYHTNSPEFAEFYAQKFKNNGITNVRFVVTSVPLK